jgi:hypothetical protein
MDKLFPIIRRVRRPLLPRDEPDTDVPAAVLHTEKTDQPQRRRGAEKSAETRTNAAPIQQKSDDASAA